MIISEPEKSWDIWYYEVFFSIETSSQGLLNANIISFKIMNIFSGLKRKHQNY